MSKPSRQVLVLANATRLLNDATILLDHRRFASAFALAVLAVEEIGKALIETWNADAWLAEPQNRSLHIQKQLAVSSLLLGEMAVRQFAGGGVADLEGERLTTVTTFFNESERGQLFQRIRAQQLDKRKQSAIYQDDWLVAVGDDFAQEHVASVFQIARNAKDVIDDGHIRRAGRAFYDLTLRHLKVPRNHWSYRPDPELKGSYYRRIEDIQRALVRFEVSKLPPNSAAQFVGYYFGAEKLAKAIIGIAKSISAEQAFERRVGIDPEKVKAAVGPMRLDISDNSIDALFVRDEDAKQPDTAREIRNRLFHDFGPTQVCHVRQHAPRLIPLMVSFIGDIDSVLAHLRRLWPVANDAQS